MDLGIVAALPSEIRTLNRGRSIPAGIVIPLTDRVALIRSGIGAQQARLGGQLLLDRGVNALLGWGTAAALDSRLTSGDLLLPREIIGADLTRWPVDADWHRALDRRLSEAFTLTREPLVESHTVVSSPLHKHTLYHDSGAVAVDMESAALARLAAAARAPFVAIRVVVDTAQMFIPHAVSWAVDTTGHLHVASLLWRLWQCPHQWMALARLARGFRAAQATLHAVARYLNTDFSSPGSERPLA